MNRDEVRAHLTGPFPSISTPFNENGSVDYDGLRNQIDFIIAAGSKTGRRLARRRRLPNITPLSRHTFP